MRAVTGYHRAENRADAMRWLMDNGFSNINGWWMNERNMYAVIEKMPASGRFLVRVGV